MGISGYSQSFPQKESYCQDENAAAAFSQPNLKRSSSVFHNSAIESSRFDRFLLGKIRSALLAAHNDESINHRLCSSVSHHLKPFQSIFLPSADTALLTCNLNLPLNCVHAVQIGQQQASAPATGYNDAIPLHIQLIR